MLKRGFAAPPFPRRARIPHLPKIQISLAGFYFTGSKLA